MFDSGDSSENDPPPERVLSRVRRPTAAAECVSAAAAAAAARRTVACRPHSDDVVCAAAEPLQRERDEVRRVGGHHAERVAGAILHARAAQVQRDRQHGAVAPRRRLVARRDRACVKGPGCRVHARRVAIRQVLRRRPARFCCTHRSGFCCIVLVADAHPRRQGQLHAAHVTADGRDAAGQAVLGFVALPDGMLATLGKQHAHGLRRRGGAAAAAAAGGEHVAALRAERLQHRRRARLS
mmetsp:Transcript_20672/g.61705  ORF Transcript_20672/g.61705 Transcript_20672/m.61705 type:complete len:239 (+) Transcript_20672:1447-2163(+)